MKKIFMTAVALVLISSAAQATDRHIPARFVGAWCAVVDGDNVSSRRATKDEEKRLECNGNSGGLMILDQDGMAMPEPMDVVEVACLKSGACIVSMRFWRQKAFALITTATSAKERVRRSTL